MITRRGFLGALTACAAAPLMPQTSAFAFHPDPFAMSTMTPVDISLDYQFGVDWEWEGILEADIKPTAGFARYVTASAQAEGR